MTATHQMMHGQLGTRGATAQRAYEDVRGVRRAGDAARRRAIVAAVAAIRHRADATAHVVDAAHQTARLRPAGTSIALMPGSKSTRNRRTATATQTGSFKEVSNETSARSALTAHRISEFPDRG